MPIEHTEGTSTGSFDPAEAHVIDRLKAHDQDTIRDVYGRYADAIYRYALYQTGQPALAEDVASEVFVRMLEKIESYSYRGVPLSSWLYRIARNLITDHHRRDGRLKPLDEEGEARLLADDPAGLAQVRLDGEEVRGALAGLTDEQREVIVLRFVEDLPGSEVAAIVGKSHGSVKSLQHRALHRLGHILRGQQRV